ncbi:MAG: hypothetical protein WCT99_13575 [Bacteroidota bacterium]
MHKTVLILMIVILLCIGVNCKKDPVTPPVNPLQLMVEDMSCTEVYLKLSLSSGEQNRTLVLKRDDSVVAAITMTNNDSLFVDDGLLPNKTYTYSLISNNWKITEQATTMDTTTQKFTWQIDTLGTSSTPSSVLYDVAIISDTLIMAVGEIFQEDSSGQTDLKRYNFVVQENKKWAIKRLPYHYQGSQYVNPINSVFSFNHNNIWFGGNGLIYFDGQNYIEDLKFNPLWGSYLINRMWSNSQNNIFVIGTDGQIAHNDGVSWSKEESNTSQHLYDIYGTDKTIVVSGSDINAGKGIVLRKNDAGWETIGEGEVISPNQLFKPKLYGSLASVWVDEKNTIYAAGNLLYKYQFNKWSYVTSLPENFINGNPNVYYRGFISKIRGNKSNDMWIAGDRNTLRHFNGYSWVQVGLPYDPQSDIIWRSLDVKGNLCVAVGEAGNRAIVIRIKK